MASTIKKQHVAKHIETIHDELPKVWRNAMAYTYIIINVCDFLIFPILWSLGNSLLNGKVGVEWHPLTLESGGLFHIAFGSVLGISTFQDRVQKVIEVVREESDDA